MHWVAPPAVRIADTCVYGSNVPSSMNFRSPDAVRLTGSSSTMASGPSAFSSTSTDCRASRSAGGAGFPPTCSWNQNTMSASGVGYGDQRAGSQGRRDHRVICVADLPEHGGVIQVAEREEVKPVAGGVLVITAHRQWLRQRQGGGQHRGATRAGDQV